MSNTQLKNKEIIKTLSPIQSLSQRLESEMKDVNALILANMQSEIPLIPQLAGYLIAAGGKRIRPLLTLAATQLFSSESLVMDNAYKLATAVEFIHTATLLHDDVVDESAERRGQDAANLIYGNQASVLVGDFLFSKAFQMMVDTHSIHALSILSNASAIIAEGEVLQLTLMNNGQTTMANYLQIIEAKTAALFAAACEVGPLIAGADKKAQHALKTYGLNMGIAFQITDDTLDYMADRTTLGKAIGDDFREGKMTAPILLAMEKANQTEQDFWQRTMGEKNQKDGDLEQAQSLIQKHETISASIAMAQSYGTKAKDALNDIDNIKDSQIKSNLLALIDFTIQRTH